MSDIASPPRDGYDWSDVDWRGVPHHLREGLRRYVEDGVPTGGGLAAILRNAPLCEAIPCFDVLTLGAVFTIIKFLRAAIPALAWGSSQAVDAWIEHGGFRGKDRG